MVYCQIGGERTDTPQWSRRVNHSQCMLGMRQFAVSCVVTGTLLLNFWNFDDFHAG